MSIRSRRQLVSALAAIAFMVASADSRADSASVKLPDVGSLVIVVDGDYVRARVAHAPAMSPPRNQTVVVEKRLEREVRRASQIITVAEHGFSEAGRIFFVLGIAIPSVKKQGSGYCGAGTEDYLLLVEWKAWPQRIELRDSIQVQSCLHAMSLGSDQGSDLRVVLRGIDDPAKVVLSWLQHPRYGPATKTLAAAAGEFVLLP